jgi:hypothetical protein
MTFKKRQARLALALVLFILPLALLGTPQPRRLTFGVYGGWSQGLGYEFSWHWRSSRSDDYSLDLNLGAYVQYNLSAVFSIQSSVNYQHGTNDWIFRYPGWPYEEGTDKFRIVSGNLNGIINDRHWGAITFYLLGGGGITSGDWEAFRGTYFNLTAGAGVKVYISRSHPNLALNFGGTFVHLINPDEYEDYTADYLRFLIGIEF